MMNPNVYESTARKILGNLGGDALPEYELVDANAAQAWATLALVEELRTLNLVLVSRSEHGSVAWRKARGRLGLEAGRD